METHLRQVDGVMLGRAAYHDPWVIADQGLERAVVVTRMHAYCTSMIAQGHSLRSIARHMLGLYHGHPRARLWRRMLSDPARFARNDPALLLEALAAVEGDRPLAQAA